MAATIRVGIVGATITPGGSGWGANAHVPALHAVPDFQLKAVCTAHADTAEASAHAFGAELAFHDIDEMAAHPEVDLVAVSVRAPWHRDLVMAGLRAGKPVFCEWPLGANLAEAQEMADYARDQGLRTAVGLQGRSDPAVRYASDLVAQGRLGEILSANLSVMTQAAWERGSGRLWQRLRANGANTLTIAGGHGIDAMCAVLGEFSEVRARATTRVAEWRDTGMNAMVPVDSPDTIGLAGVLTTGVEVTVQVAAVPRPSGSRLEIYGRNGTLTLVSGGALSTGPNQIFAALQDSELTALPVPEEYTLVPEGTPSGPPRNVAQGYARLAEVWESDGAFMPDFEHALTRHRLLDAIERSSVEGRAVQLSE
ncbi:MAG: Gfo/Idh/MocA family oxidoreductase [Dehalococcoidia bacterium]